MSEYDENVRVVRESRDLNVLTPERSTAQQRRDDILEDVEAHLRASRDSLSYALENMKIIMVPQHDNIETLIGQLIEQTIEERARWR